MDVSEWLTPNRQMNMLRRIATAYFANTYQRTQRFKRNKCDERVGALDPKPSVAATSLEMTGSELSAVSVNRAGESWWVSKAPNFVTLQRDSPRVNSATAPEIVLVASDWPDSCVATVVARKPMTGGQPTSAAAGKRVWGGMASKESAERPGAATWERGNVHTWHVGHATLADGCQRSGGAGSL